jgi:hypothetical protein
MAKRCGGLIEDCEYWIKGKVERDSNLGCQSGRRSTQRSGVEWSGVEWSGVRSLERRRPKFAAPGVVGEVSGGSCGFGGRGCRMIDHSWSQVAELFMRPPVVIAVEPDFQALAQG